MGSVYRSTINSQFNFLLNWAARQQPAAAPSAPPTIQTTFPTSAYGQTIPVVYGKFRAPGGYVWAAPISTLIDDNTINVILTARVRFGRPLVDNSSWRLRRLWAGGTLIYDAANSVRSPLISILREYDGQSTQGRDPTMVEIEGEAEVSAHRGYLDIVIKMDLGAQADAPPVFDAEWVQDAAGSYATESFEAFFADEIDGHPVPYWDEGTFWGWSDTPQLLRKFSVAGLREIYFVSITALGGGNDDIIAFRYIPGTNRIIAIANSGGTTATSCILVDADTGAVVSESASNGLNTHAINSACLVSFGGVSALIVLTNLGRLFAFRALENDVDRTYLNSSFASSGIVTRVAPGAVRESSADVWAVAGINLYKLVVNSSGVIVSETVHATFADDLVYVVYHDGDVVVWTDNAQVIKVDSSTAVTLYTKTVPYQIGTNLADADLNRISDVLMFEETTRFNFTDLRTGDTEEVVKSFTTATPFAYDDQSNWAVQTNNLGVPKRHNFDVVGDGSTRNLSDFVAAIWEAGDAFASTEHDEIGFDDTIQGGVIDVTGGSREIVRSIAEPYSFAIFERGDQIITKRAATDGSFVVDATIAASDIVDRGGQAIRARRLNPEEFVARYGINYRDPDEIYQPRPQFGEIPFVPFPVAPTDFSVKADVPVIVDGDTIKTLATKRVNKLAVERHEITMTLKAKFSDLEPEDILQFEYAGRTVTARITETTLNPDFTIEVKCTEFLPTVAVSVSGATGRPTQPSAAGSPASAYYHLDIPLQADGHDLNGGGLVQYHVLTSMGQTNWDGATLYRQAGGYVAVSAQTEVGLVGVALTQLADADNPYVTEFTRTVDVGFIAGDASTISTKTYQQVMEGANKFAIGAPGRWEVCHVITITNNGDGSYTFEGLVRGRGTSEEFTGDHAVGDYVVWLSDDNVQHLGYSLDSLNDAFSFKAVGIGGTLASTSAVSRTVTGEAEKIPKPCQLDAVIDGSDIDISWVRRSRIGSFWADDGDYEAPLGESLEQYVLRIKDGPGGTVLRTFTVDDATIKTYLSADITTDFGSMPGELTFDIRQVSGTGVVCPTREATISL